MKKLFFYAGIFAAAMTACTNENITENNNEEGIQTISAEIIQPAMDATSRVIIGGNPGDGVRPMTWRADDPETKANEADAIYLYDSKGGAARFLYSEPEGNAKGVFVKTHGNIVDIKNALCVPSTTGRPNDMPANINDTFNFASTMMYHRGIENAPMYGEMGTNGVLQFRQVTGLFEIEVENMADYRTSVDQMLCLKVEGYTLNEEGKEVKKLLSATNAKLINTDSYETATLDLTGGDNVVSIFIQKNTSVENRLHCPLMTGEYSKIVLSIWKLSNYTTDNNRLSEYIELTPASGKTFTIDKKLYSVKKRFELKKTK